MRERLLLLLAAVVLVNVAAGEKISLADVFPASASSFFPGGAYSVQAMGNNGPAFVLPPGCDASVKGAGPGSTLLDFGAASPHLPLVVPPGASPAFCVCDGDMHETDDAVLRPV